MEHKKASNAICFDNTKQAALYFDRVFSAILLKEFAREIVIDGDLHRFPLKLKRLEFFSSLHEEAFYELAFGLSASDAKDKIPAIFFDLYLTLLTALMGVAVGSILIEDEDAIIPGIPFHCTPKEEEVLTRLYVDNVPLSFLRRCPETDMGLRQFVLSWLGIMGIDHPSAILPHHYSLETDYEESQDVAAVLTNVQLIDANEASWEQILEVRRDMECRTKLRNLKLFLYTNYNDKPAAFIEDDLARRVEEYHRVCRQHGLQTCLSTLCATVNSKDLLTSAVAGLSAAFLGGPIAGIGAAAVIQIANISVELSKAYASYRKLKQDHQTTYIIEGINNLDKRTNEK